MGKLTDDDLKNIAGKRQPLVGKLQERYAEGAVTGPTGARTRVHQES